MSSVDKTVFGRHSLRDSDEMDRRTRDYWMAQSAEDRFLGMEMLRRMRHGDEYATFRVDRSVFGKRPLREVGSAMQTDVEEPDGEKHG